MTPEENLITLRLLRKIGGSEFASPSEHLRAISQRLAYLFKKLETIPETVKRPYFQDDEIDALFWLLANHHVHTGQDVLRYMKRVAGNELIDFKRFDRVLQHIIAARQKLGADTPREAA